LLLLHIHGERGSYFDLLKDYDVDALSWEDRLAGPTMDEARRRTGKCLIGGVDHLRALAARPDEVRAEALDAIRQTEGRGFILAPGCTFDDHTPEANVRALGEASEYVGIGD
jgi:uroporphyrinogen decarboxylase